MMSETSKKPYRIVHIFGKSKSGKSLDDEICIIENDDGEDIEESHDLKFYWRFTDNDDFEDSLKRSGRETDSLIEITDYYEYDVRFQKNWWHWNSHSYKKIKPCRIFYRTKNGAIVNKIDKRYISPPQLQRDNCDGALCINWLSFKFIPTNAPFRLETKHIDDLIYENDILGCDCPFCGNPSKTKLEDTSSFKCENCRKTWKVSPNL